MRSLGCASAVPGANSQQATRTSHGARLGRKYVAITDPLMGIWTCACPASVANQRTAAHRHAGAVVRLRHPPPGPLPAVHPRRTAGLAAAFASTRAPALTVGSRPAAGSRAPRREL